MTPWLKWIETHPGVGISLLSKIAATLFVIIGAILLNKLLKKILEKQTFSAEKAYTRKRIVLYIIVIVSIVIVMRVWIEGMQTLLTFIGILSAGIAIALKDIFANMAGWLMIIWRNPFNVGDRIQFGEISGDVVDIRLFQFTLLEIRNWVDSDQTTGRLIHIPNNRIFQDPQANYTQGFQYIWNELSITITFESKYQKAKKITEELLNEIAGPLGEGAEVELIEARKRFLILSGTIRPKVYVKVAESGVVLSMRYLVPARKRRDSEHNIWQVLLDRYSEHEDIQLAYPTQRIYYVKPENTDSDILNKNKSEIL